MIKHLLKNNYYIIKLLCGTHSRVWPEEPQWPWPRIKPRNPGTKAPSQVAESHSAFWPLELIPAKFTKHHQASNVPLKTCSERCPGFPQGGHLPMWPKSRVWSQLLVCSAGTAHSQVCSHFLCHECLFRYHDLQSCSE